MSFLYLLIAIANTVYGVLLFSTINADTPGLTVIFVVAAVLTGFGIWGFVSWIKSIVSRDTIDAKDALDNWWKTVRTFDAILIIGLLFRFFILQPFIVEGPSMQPNFQDKEAILVDKISFRLRTPERGETVIFKAPPSPADDYIKRIIALPGETVTIDHGKVFIDGKLLDESYLAPENRIPETAEYLQKKVGPNEYFVMGDNRPHSSDSRDWGDVPAKNLIGRAAVSVYPFNMIGIIKKPAVN